MNAIATAGVLIFKNNQVLLVRHTDKARHLTGSYGLPAGRLEPGEKAIQAAIRELAEETGLITTESDLEELPLHIPHVDIKRKDGTTQRFSITVFLCRKYSGKIVETEETIPEWIGVKTIDKLALIGHTKEMVTEGKKYV